MSSDSLDVTSRQERVEALTDADWVRLGSAAKFHASLLWTMEAADLVHEAVMRLLDPERRDWKRGDDAVRLILATVRSIAFEWRKSEKREVVESRIAPALAHSISDYEPGFLDQQPANSSGPDANLSARDVIRAVEEHFADDEDVIAVLVARLEGLSRDEAQREFNLTPIQYASAEKRLRRAVLRGAFNGVKHG